MINIEIVKENFKFQMYLPVGVSWDVCEQAIDELKECVLEMKRTAHEQAQARAQEVSSQEEVESEISEVKE